MRPTPLALCLALCVAVPLAGCAKKQTETASEAISDSLIASEPIEQPGASLTPKVPYQPAPTPGVPVPPRRSRREVAHSPAQEPPPAANATPPTPATPSHPARPVVMAKWGTFLHVTVSDALSSETAHPGDAWGGTLRDSVFADDALVFPAGSAVHGTVKDVKPAKAGDRAMLELEVTSIDAFGSSQPVSAGMDPLVAESPRARNLGSIAGATAAGALLGNLIGGRKGAVIGGVAGGAAAGGAVARSKGYQVVLKPGSSVTFSLSRDVAVQQ